MRSKLILVVVSLLIISGCATPPERIAQTPSGRQEVIIDSNIIPGIKRSLDVRLNKKVSEAALRAIALKLKSQDSRNYERTFICYYLPDMEVGAGAWATTHFNPNQKRMFHSLFLANFFL